MTTPPAPLTPAEKLKAAQDQLAADRARFQAEQAEARAELLVRREELQAAREDLDRQREAIRDAVEARRSRDVVVPVQPPQQAPDAVATAGGTPELIAAQQQASICAQVIAELAGGAEEGAGLDIAGHITYTAALASLAVAAELARRTVL